jgi:hypothetical protein
MVMALWFIELGIRHVLELLAVPRVEFGTLADLGIERVRISPELDAADALAGGFDRDY